MAPERFPEPSFDPVADHCAADLLGDRETDAHHGVRILAVADEQDEAGHGRALAAVGSKEVGAFLKCG